MKKFILGLFTSVLLVSIFTACDSKGQPSDTVKWINTTHAILTETNGGDVNLFGGFSKNETNSANAKVLLEEWWGVTDRASADEMIEFLMKEGHRTGYVEEMTLLKKDGVFDVSRQEAREYLKSLELDNGTVESYIAAMDAYETRGANAIDAWDYTRALNLLADYYLAGYYTEKEALDKALDIAKELQTFYTSWDEMVESYLTGYAYWSGKDPKDPSTEAFKRRKIYEKLKAGSNNPYAIDWNTTLEKTW